MHVTRSVLDIVLAFARYLSNLQNGVLLLKQLCDHILFNPAIWIHAPAKVREERYWHRNTHMCRQVDARTVTHTVTVTSQSTTQLCKQEGT